MSLTEVEAQKRMLQLVRKEQMKEQDNTPGSWPEHRPITKTIRSCKCVKAMHRAKSITITSRG